MRITDGGKAFPSGYVRRSRPAHDPGAHFVETDQITPINEGMTLRDYFAAAALQGMLSDSNLQADYFEFSRRAYEMADAMLEARK